MTKMNMIDWSKAEAKKLSSRGSQPRGRDTSANLQSWGDYAKANSVNQNKIKAQSKRDLAHDGDGRESDWSKTDWRVPQKDSEGSGWAPISKTTARNCYTGPGGSKRD